MGFILDIPAIEVIIYILMVVFIVQRSTKYFMYPEGKNVLIDGNVFFMYPHTVLQGLVGTA